MAFFCIQTETNENARVFFKDTNERLLKNDFVTNPFKGSIKTLDNTHIVDMVPIYPRFFLGGLFPLLTWFFLWPKTFLLIAGIIILSFGFFWTKYFIYIFMRLGLRKAKYTGKIKMINDSEVLKGIIQSYL